MPDITLTHDEAVSLYNHLELSILTEIRESGDDYDNMSYLVNLIHIYEKCKEANDLENNI